MNFVPSMTDPPPTASRKSAPSARTFSTARIRVRKRGFGSMPPNSEIAKPARAARTSARVPALSALPPP